jgi:hypothetical protein
VGYCWLGSNARLDSCVTGAVALSRRAIAGVAVVLLLILFSLPSPLSLASSSAS